MRRPSYRFAAGALLVAAFAVACWSVVATEREIAALYAGVGAPDGEYTLWSVDVSPDGSQREAACAVALLFGVAALRSARSARGALVASGALYFLLETFWWTFGGRGTFDHADPLSHAAAGAAWAAGVCLYRAGRRRGVAAVAPAFVLASAASWAVRTAQIRASAESLPTGTIDDVLLGARWDHVAAIALSAAAVVAFAVAGRPATGRPPRFGRTRPAASPPAPELSRRRVVVSGACTTVAWALVLAAVGLFAASWPAKPEVFLPVDVPIEAGDGPTAPARFTADYDGTYAVAVEFAGAGADEALKARFGETFDARADGLPRPVVEVRSDGRAVALEDGADWTSPSGYGLAYLRAERGVVYEVRVRSGRGDVACADLGPRLQVRMNVGEAENRWFAALARRAWGGVFAAVGLAFGVIGLVGLRRGLTRGRRGT